LTPDLLAAFDALPVGGFEASYEGRRYHVTRQSFSNGKSQKLVAQELGGSDYISTNVYRLTSGALLKPCEMPEEKVIAFILGVTPVGTAPRRSSNN
jgi:hypothetical protein